MLLPDDSEPKISVTRPLGMPPMPNATSREIEPVEMHSISVPIPKSPSRITAPWPTPDPFGRSAIDELILDEFDRILELPGRRVIGNWIGTYASADGRWRFTETPLEGVRLVVVTAGCGASTSFAIGEETIADLFGTQAGA